MTPSPPSGYRPDIDGLRAVAVLSVVFCHLKLFLDGGYVGVDVFFVISGFLITRIIHTELEAGTFSLVGFWERRVRRLVPALAVVTLATAVGGWFFLLPGAYASFGRSLASVWLMTANVHFWKDAGYFAAADQHKPLLHTWSLAVEEQFYLILPLVLLLLARRSQLKRATLVLGLLAAGTLLLAIRGVFKGHNASFYLIQFRAWELFAGSLLALLARRLPPRPNRATDAVSLLGLALILVPCFLYTEHTPFPGAAALPPVLGSVLLIWGGTGSGPLPLVNRWLGWRPLVAVGLWSYSIYLWHWPLWIWLRAYTIHLPDIALRLALVPGVVAVGYLSYRGLETPFRKRTLLPARMSLFAAAGAVSIVLIGGGTSIAGQAGFPGRLPADVKLLAQEPPIAAPYRAAFIEAHEIPDGMRSYGAPGARPEVLVWGDSHAVCWLPAVEALCAERGTRAAAATRQATPPVLDHADPVQRRFSEAVLEYLRTSGIRRVVLSARWGHPVVPVRKLPAAVAELRRLGCQVYVVGDVPDYSFEIPWGLAMTRLWKRDPAMLGISMEQHRARNAAYYAHIPELERLGARILDPLPVLQAHTGSFSLLPFDSEGSLYADGHHLNVHGALALKELLAPVVEGLPTAAKQVSPPGSTLPAGR